MRELLEGFEELAAFLGCEGKASSKYARPLFLLTFLNLLIIVTTRDIMLMLVIITLLALLVPRVDRIRRRIVLKILALSLFFSIPVIITHTPSAVLFLLKVASSSLLVAVTISLVGWSTIAKGMEGIIMPKGFADASRMMLIYAERWARELIKIIIARKARTMTEDWKKEIMLRASGVGELLYRSLERASSVALAVESRTFGAEENIENGPEGRFVLALHITLVLLRVISHVRV